MPRPARYEREESLRKAVNLFWTRGYHASSLKQIERALDMRPASIYSAFGSKDALFAEALAAYGEAGLVELDRHVEQYESIIDALQAYLRQVAQTCCDASSQPTRACLVVKTLLEASHTQPELARQAQQCLDRIEERLATWIVKAGDRGELVDGADCLRLARLLQAQIVAVRAMAERQLAPAVIEALGDDMAAILDTYRRA